MSEPVLQVENLTVTFPGRRGAGITVIDDVSFDIRPGETLSLVGLVQQHLQQQVGSGVAGVADQSHHSRPDSPRQFTP